ncbi:MAG: hypothetical protein ACJA1N_001272 [Saprospiraceae bacterium]|jgi:hypothetical protein
MNWQKKDELVGGWYSGASEESAFHDMLQGFGIAFKADGTGIRDEWYDGSAETETVTSKPEVPFKWERINEDTIKMKFDDAQGWDEVNYEITFFQGGYEVIYDKIVIKGTETFWECEEPVYKAIVKPVSLARKIGMVILFLIVIITSLVMWLR